MRHAATNPTLSVPGPARSTQRRILPARHVRYLALRARTVVESDHLALRLVFSSVLVIGVAVAVSGVLRMVAEL